MNSIKFRAKLLLIGLAVCALLILLSFKVLDQPEKGFVPDAETAIKIAEAIWYPIYGESIYEEKPYKAELKNGVWFVSSTMKEGLGGVAMIQIQKSDCKVLLISHGK